LLRALIHKQTQTNDIHNLSLHDALPIFNVTQSAIKTAVVRINLTRLFQECLYSGKSFINCAMSNQKKLSEKIIIGVDPGTQVMGYGIISVVGQEINLLQYGVIKLNKYSTHELKLKKIFERVIQLI